MRFSHSLCVITSLGLSKRKDARVDQRKVLQMIESVFKYVSGTNFEQWAAERSQYVAENIAFVMVVFANFYLLNQGASNRLAVSLS